MPYKGSYMWGLRQKVGSDLVLNSTVDVLAVRDDGKVLLVFNKDFQAWSTVGGNVEVGDTWRSAAVNELLEEGGLLADKDDLTCFATVSGPGWGVQYPNGDKTQSFSVVFIVKKWREDESRFDEEEISEKRFFSLDEAKGLKRSMVAQNILTAYEQYLESSEFQTIEVKKEEK